MAQNVKTIIKMFLLFLFFQITLQFIVEIAPELNSNLSASDEDYIDFLIDETNLFQEEDTGLTGTQKGQTLLVDFEESLELENLFNDGIIESFLGIFKIIGQIILFIVEVGLLVLITPSIIMSILLYNFVAVTSFLMSLTLLVNIFFYMIIFYIVFKARTNN